MLRNNSAPSLLAGLVLIIGTFAFVGIVPISAIAGEWNYQSPEDWSNIASTCGGQHQSPIDIDNETAVPVLYPRFVFHNYDREFPMNATNTGHSVMIQVTTSAADRPYITRGGLGYDIYLFHQLHFHWGSTDTKGSEHTIASKSYAAEMHLVHYNAKYGSLQKAVNHADGLAVLGIMIKVKRSDNSRLGSIGDFDELFPNESVETVSLPRAVPLKNLLPKNVDAFYRYAGSLTTPACSQSVIWTVFENSIPISARQMNGFRGLKNHLGEPMVDNYRPVQPLNGRIVTRKTSLLS